MSHTLGRARGSFCLGPSGPPRQALPQPYQDMTLLGTLPLWQPGFQQQFCLLGPQELGDLACGRAACWEMVPAMEVSSCPWSVVCMGLGGLGSSRGPARKQWSGSGPPSPPDDQREPLAGCPRTLGGPPVGTGAARLPPSQVGEKDQRLPRSSQDMPSGVWAMRPALRPELAQGTHTRNGSSGG